MQRPLETGKEPETLRGGAGRWDREEYSLWETDRDMKVGREAELSGRERESKHETPRLGAILHRCCIPSGPQFPYL